MPAGEGTLALLALKIATKPFIAGASEQLHIQTTGPDCVIQVADPIPGGCVGEPPFDVIPELCIQFDAMVQVMCLLGGLNHPAQECSTQGTYPTNKM